MSFLYEEMVTSEEDYKKLILHAKQRILNSSQGVIEVGRRHACGWHGPKMRISFILCLVSA